MVKAFPLNQQEYSYNAQDVSYYYAGRHSGVFALDTNCQVSIVSNMTIKVAKGKGWLAHGVDYGVVFWMEEDVLLTVPVGDVASPRWDYVCIGWETTEVKNNPTIYIKSGSPAVTPAEPILENSANKIEICLAKIYIPSGTTNLRATGVSLTDTRADKAYCGLVGDDLRITNLEERVTKIESGTTPAGEAQKAKKLSNPITINETSFDGSLPITTEKWGKARMIRTTFGQVEIDGSQNIDIATLDFYDQDAPFSQFTISGVSGKHIKIVTVRLNNNNESVTISVRRRSDVSQFVLFPATPLRKDGVFSDYKIKLISAGDNTSEDIITYNQPFGYINIILIPTMW